MDNIKTRKEVNHAFDLAKLFLSIMVIAIHMNPFGVEPVLSVAQTANFWIHQWFCRIAVPLFFIISGFLLLNTFWNYICYGRLYISHWLWYKYWGIVREYLMEWCCIFRGLSLQEVTDTCGIWMLYCPGYVWYLLCYKKTSPLEKLCWFHLFSIL